MPKRPNPKMPAKAPRKSRANMQYPIRKIEEEDEYDDDVDEEEEEEAENDSFINNEEVEEENENPNEDRGAIYRNDEIFEKEKAKRIKREKGFKGEEEDEPYQEENEDKIEKEEKEEKQDDNELSDDNNLNESDLEVGQEYKNLHKKKKRLRKKGDDKKKFKRELDNLKDDYIEGEARDNSSNENIENSEEEGSGYNRYRKTKHDDNFIEDDREPTERRYHIMKKQKIGIEQIEQHISEEDKIIVNADYPERLVTRYKIEDLKNLSQEIREEVEWICEKKNYNDFPNKKKKINTLLELFKKDFLDMPYVIEYKFYLFEHDFQKSELWQIFELDMEYQKLIELKKKVMSNFNTLEPYLNEKIYHNMKEKCIDNAKTMQDLNNMMIYINYNKEKYLPKNMNQDDEFVLPIRKSQINVQYNRDFEKCAEQFCLNPNDVASNIELIQNKENVSKLLHPPTPDFSSYDMCQKLNIKNMKNPKIMENICHLVAKEMMCHPYLKEFVYNYLRHNCYVSTTPTEEGKKQLDVFHPSFRTKHIKERPIKTFNDDLFLDIYQREKDKLIEINLEIKQDPESMKIFKEIFTQALNNEQNSNIDNNEFGSNNIGIKQEKDMNDDDNDYNYNSDTNKSEWFTLRENIIKFFLDSIGKQFLTDVKKELKESAENFVINSCAENFDKLLMNGPYIVQENDEEKGLSGDIFKKGTKKNKKSKKNEEGEENEIEEVQYDETDNKFLDNELPRIIIFIFDSNIGQTYAVALNQNGEKIDQKIFNFNFNYQDRSRQMSENNLTQEQESCKKFIEKNDPNLILIGANDLKCNNIKEQISKIITNGNFSIKHFLHIAFGDLSIPEIYANSPISDLQIESKNMYIKQAISLGRYWQSPLHEILQLWSPNVADNFCLKIKLHPMQKYVDQKKLMDKMELRAIKVVNKCGFDLNRGLDYIHLRNTLQFISGFGPIKARAFISATNASERPSTRDDILENDSYGIGRKLGESFINFIKIKTNITRNNRNNNVDNYNLLDMTRIPVDSYDTAIKLINTVYKKEENPGNKKHKKSEGEKVEEIMRHPDKLNVLDINEYINKQKEVLKGAEFEQLKFIIKLIKEELTYPFKDPRKDKIELNSTQIFYLLIGDENFIKGVITAATVMRVEQDHILCKLQNGLIGSLWSQDIFDDGEKNNKEKIKEIFKPGTVFEARVKEIDFAKFKVDLIKKPKDMRDHKEYIPNVDKFSNFFELLDEDRLNMPYINAHSQKNRKYQPRNIKHNKFRNITYLECCNLLKNKEIGDCYFRPSSLGNNNLTLSYKFYKQIICHLDIVEEGKIPGENIGSKLRIGSEVYSSLDEIVKRYVYPCTQLIKESINSRKFVHCETKNDFDNTLKEDKRKNENIVNYNYTILKDYPGYIVLGYVPKANPHYEYIKIKPKGLYFHDQYFPSLDDITNFFKKEYSTSKYREFINKSGVPMVQYHQRIETNNNSSIPLDEQNDNKFGNSSRFNNSMNMGSSFGKRDKLCKICQKPGHFAKECPNKDNNNFGDRRRDGRNNNNFIGGKRYRDNRDNRDREHGFKKERYDKGNDFNDSWGKKQEKNNDDNWGKNDNNDDWGNNNNNDGWGNDVKKENEDGWTNIKKEDEWGNTKNEDGDGWGNMKNEDGWGSTKKENEWDENKNNVGDNDGWN